MLRKYTLIGHLTRDPLNKMRFAAMCGPMGQKPQRDGERFENNLISDAWGVLLKGWP